MASDPPVSGGRLQASAVTVPGVPDLLSVLLVEDDPSDVRILSDQLARSPSFRCRVQSCGSLEEALGHPALPTADVVLLDLGLPDSTGLETCRRFLASSPSVPVLVLTGLGGESLGVEAVQRGAQDFLPKDDVRPESLARAIRHAVERHSLLEALRKAAAEARDRERALRRVLERSVEALVVLAEDRTVRFANRAASLLLARETTDLEGAPWTEAVPEPDAEESDGPREILLSRPGLPPSAAEARWTPVEWEGRPARLVSLLDLTDRRRAERIALAQSVQRAFLPERTVAGEGCLVAAASNELCEDVSGDFYDFVKRADGRLLVALGDVTGHGLGAALLMAQARAALRAFGATESDLGVVLARMNRILEGDALQGAFLTLFLAAIDPVTARVEWASAGHSFAAILDAGGCARPLPATAPPLWVAPDFEFPAGEPVTLEEGGGLVVFSDGAVEIPDESGRHLGFASALDAFAAHWHEPPHDVIRHVRAELHRWSVGRSPSDDLTLLALRRTSGRSPGVLAARPAAADFRP